MVWMLLFQNRTYILMFQSNPDKHRIPNQNRTYHFLTTNFKLFALKSKRNRLSKLIMDIQINFWDSFFLNYLEDTWDTKKFIYCKTTLEADVHLWYGQTQFFYTSLDLPTVFQITGGTRKACCILFHQLLSTCREH